MGGYLILNIEFPNKKERDKFEKMKVFIGCKTKFKRMFQYVDREYICYYYPIWMGYAEPQDILKRCRKKKIKINDFLSLDLSSNGTWYDEIKQKSMEYE
jgi:hypothetical protein